MAKKNKYDNESITSLKGADRVRKRPSVIFGSDSLEGCEHAFFEILSNSIDEAKEGYGSVIDVVKYDDGSYSVEDFGRGIPLDFNKGENRFNWELVYEELYAGGKYDNNNGGDYEYSLGLNGLGACATQYASEFFDVEVHREGKLYTLHFEKGANVGGLKKTRDKASNPMTGTFQRWKPDLDVFTDIDISDEFLKLTLKRQAIINPGITFNLTVEGGYHSSVDDSDELHFSYCYPEGILGYVKELAHDTSITTPYTFSGVGQGKDREDKPEYKIKFDIAFAFTNDEPVIRYFHNSSFLENGGSPDKAVKAAFVAVVDDQIRSQNLYKASEDKITFSDIEDSLTLFSNSFSTQTSYANQTKKAISNKFIQAFMTTEIKEKLTIWFIENKFDSDKAIAQILANKRSRETAEKQRLIVKKKLMGNTETIGNKPAKFVDCRTKDKARREIFICEGDSAAGAIKLGRDAEFQAIMPIRGKILNCLKASVDQIFRSEIITDLIRILGCGVEVRNKHAKDLNNFDLKNLKWNKVIIATDADEDGFQIRTLVLTMIYTLMPMLIEEGYVYIAQTPLYEITYHKSKDNTETYFAFDEAEKNRYVKDKNPAKIKLERSKGLGENEPDMMNLTTLNPATRKLIKVSPEDADIMKESFELFLGNNVARRKEYIEANGYKYADQY
ncbi:MAG: DNA topoisomerase [Clostridiales Family XIII bacterium]|jgi:DNA gyrase subunit B|nr:DNA topoisomerase [Clostridiales Family XIII bacterium]